MKRLLPLLLAAVVLAGFASFYISNGKWESSIIDPIRHVAGAEVADKVDSSVRGGLDSGEEFLREAGNTSVPDLLGQIVDIPSPESKRIPKYERDLFGDGWALVRDGCNTREVVLMRDLDDVTMRDDRTCKVHTGVLTEDPYTGQTIHFDSVKDPQAVQIDHVVPLSVAWQMGAWEWSTEKRIEFSNDQANLYAVDGPENSRKSDKTPSRWMPKNEAFTCQFAISYTEVTAKWDLAMDRADRDTLQGVLEQC